MHLEIPRDKRTYLFALCIFIFALVGFSIAPPWHFPKGSIITVEEGSGLYALSNELKAENVIRSPFWFRVASIILRGEHNMKAGEYYLNNPQSSFIIAWRIFRGDYGVENVKVTVPEGFTVKKISALFGQKFAYFDNPYFEKNAPEGYLFPDTYFISVTATATSTIKLMRDNFVRKIFPVMPEVEASGKSLDEIIVMASLIEGEANNQEDRLMVSDVLWKRLKNGMPLQVDVDKKTYEFQGLPDEPINNPGLASIEAAIHPIKTPYLYYLTGNDGKMHYAKTFDEHKENIRKYLQ